MRITNSPKLTAAQIVQKLRDEILAGRLSAGERLTEAALSARFDVGRGLVREAIQHLTHQGLLQTKRNCGAVVAPEAPKPVRDLIVPIRRTIEVYALRLVHDNLTQSDYASWEKILADMRIACETGDMHAIAEADLGFHRLLLERAGQPDLLIIWETLVARLRSYFRAAQRRCARLLDIHDEHQELLEAFRGLDTDAAAQLLESKIN